MRVSSSKSQKNWSQPVEMRMQIKTHVVSNDIYKNNTDYVISIALLFVEMKS